VAYARTAFHRNVKAWHITAPAWPVLWFQKSFRSPLAASTKEKGEIQTREKQDQKSKKDKLRSKFFVTFFFVFLCIEIEEGKKADKSTISLNALVGHYPRQSPLRSQGCQARCRFQISK